MTPLKLYLLRAVHDWAVESGYTPHVVADAKAAGVKVPFTHVDDGKIVLNVHPRAVSHFEFSIDTLRFSTRFGVRSHKIEIPYTAVLAIYAQENGQGLTFPENPPDGNHDPSPDGTPPDGKPPGKGPNLRVVK
jgi:stringent starvation protein B